MSLDWLPDLLFLEDSGGDWDLYVEVLHEYFVADFVDSKPKWPGKNVMLKRHPEYAGKSATFWHMISEGKDEEERTPEMRRSERLAWARAVIDEFDGMPPEKTDCRILWWEELRGTETRYHLAVDDFSYVVVVADRGRYVLPWTAYYVEFNHRRERLRRKWKEYWVQKAEAAP